MSDRSGIQTNDFKIYTMSALGGGLTQVTHGPWIDSDPTWAPNGRPGDTRASFIAFARLKYNSAGTGGKWSLYTIRPDGTDDVAVKTDNARSARNPTWQDLPCADQFCSR